MSISGDRCENKKQVDSEIVYLLALPWTIVSSLLKQIDTAIVAFAYVTIYPISNLNRVAFEIW